MHVLFKKVHTSVDITITDIKRCFLNALPGADEFVSHQNIHILKKNVLFVLGD